MDWRPLSPRAHDDDAGGVPARRADSPTPATVDRVKGQSAMTPSSASAETIQRFSVSSPLLRFRASRPTPARYVSTDINQPLAPVLADLRSMTNGTGGQSAEPDPTLEVVLRSRGGKSALATPCMRCRVERRLRRRSRARGTAGSIPYRVWQSVSRVGESRPIFHECGTPLNCDASCRDCSRGDPEPFTTAGMWHPSGSSQPTVSIWRIKRDEGCNCGSR